MAEIIKKELILEKFDCKKCLTNISENINLNKVKIEINKNEKNISFVVDNIDDYKKTLLVINDVLNKHEHLVEVTEKSLKRNENKTLFIGKLSCTSCANKIESRVKDIRGVASANLDFVNSKINLEIEENVDVAKVIAETKKIVKEVEPSSYVIDKAEEEEPHHHNGDEGIVRKTILTLVFGGVFFFLGLFLKVDFIYELILYLISYLIIGRSVIRKAIRNISKGTIFDENTLMMVATIGAFFIKEFNEAIAVMAFYLVGEMFQDLAVDKSRKSISSLMDIKSEYTNVKINDEIIQTKSEEVQIGSIIVVKPGEKVPLDGIIIEGSSHVDTSSITGESVPRYMGIGEEIISGFINQDKILIIKTTKTFDNSTVSKIIEMVENSSSKKAPTENFITKFARYYTPIVVVIATLLALVPPLLFDQDFKIWIYRALSFLVVSCPCALVISIPLGFYGGIGFASRRGVLIKGGNYLEALKNSEEIIFDKTGTLTKGKFVVSEINTVNSSKDELLEIVALAEFYSIHPIANAIKASFKEELDMKRVKEYQEITGQGIKAQIDNLDVLVGNRRLLENNKIEFTESDSVGTILYVAVNGKYFGNIVIIDEIKEEAFNTIKELKALGVKKTIMITGDKKDVAEAVAHQLGIDEVYSEVLPNEKANIIEERVKKGNKKVVFVGDGINDAPSLAIADVGISMGTVGSDAAIEASDIVIMNDDLEKIVDAKYISRKTSKVVWQNIIFALIVKVLVLILAAFGIVDMWAAVFADVGVSLIAILNATRILRMNIKKTGNK